MKVEYSNRSIDLFFCKSFSNRLMGFMFKRNIKCALCFPKCNCIHTFFMLKPIDVVMTDKDFKILYILKNLKPFRIILPKRKVYYTFEFPIHKFNFKLNEKIKITK